MLPSLPSTISPLSSHLQIFMFALPAAETHTCTSKHNHICEAEMGLSGYKDKETACKNPIYYPTTGLFWEDSQGPRAYM